MKNITITSGLLALIMALIMSGCTTAPKTDSEAGADEGAYSEGEGGATVGTIDTGGAFAGTALEGMKISYEKDAINDPENVLSIKTIYFDFDSSEISEETTIKPLKATSCHVSILGGCFILRPQAGD